MQSSLPINQIFLFVCFKGKLSLLPDERVHICSIPHSRESPLRTPFFTEHVLDHGLRTPNEDINQRYLKKWADVAGKICFGRT